MPERGCVSAGLERGRRSSVPSIARDVARHRRRHGRKPSARQLRRKCFLAAILRLSHAREPSDRTLRPNWPKLPLLRPIFITIVCTIPKRSLSLIGSGAQFAIRRSLGSFLLRLDSFVRLRAHGAGDRIVRLNVCSPRRSRYGRKPNGCVCTARARRISGFRDRVAPSARHRSAERKQRTARGRLETLQMAAHYGPRGRQSQRDRGSDGAPPAT
jgi:hypothetical protein